MFNEDAFVVYQISDCKILIYDKKNQKSYSLNSEEYEILRKFSDDCGYEFDEIAKCNGNIDIKLIKNILYQHKLNEKTVLNSRKVKKIYNIDKFISNNKIWKIMEFLIVFCSALFWLTQVILNCDIIKKEVNGILSNNIILNILSAIFAFVIGLLLHEFSHALVAKNNGAYVPEMAVGIKKPFVFYGYARIIGMDYINNKLKKIKIYYAGIGMNFLISAISMCLYSYTNIDFLFIFFAVFSIQAFLNLSIFNNGDGYSVIYTIFGDDVLPSKFTPEFLKCRVRKNRWIILFPIMNMLFTIALPALIIMVKIFKISLDVIWINDVFVWTSFTFLVFNFIYAIFSKNKIIIFTLSSIQSIILMIMLVLRLRLFIMNSCVCLFLTVLLLPLIASGYMIFNCCFMTLLASTKSKINKNHINL